MSKATIRIMLSNNIGNPVPEIADKKEKAKTKGKATMSVYLCGVPTILELNNITIIEKYSKQ